MTQIDSDKRAELLAAELAEARTEIAELKRSLTSEDSAEHKQAEKALRQSEARLKTILEIWDWHVPSGEAVGGFVASYNSWRQLVHPDDLDRVEEDLRMSAQAGRAFVIDLRMRTKSGAWRWVSTRGRAVERDANGAVVRMVGTHSDITERKQAEEERAKLEHQCPQDRRQTKD